MKEAKAKGMTVIFYSGIIGSIPGKIEMAKRIMSVFVKHLTEQSALTSSSILPSITNRVWMPMI
jgi:hypothetical protein